MDLDIEKILTNWHLFYPYTSLASETDWMCRNIHTKNLICIDSASLGVFLQNQYKAILISNFENSRTCCQKIWNNNSRDLTRVPENTINDVRALIDDEPWAVRYLMHQKLHSGLNHKIKSLELSKIYYQKIPRTALQLKNVIQDSLHVILLMQLQKKYQTKYL